MANLTLSVDDALLHRARVRAAQESTSVNAVVRDFLDDFVSHRSTSSDARARLIALAQASNASSEGMTWTRGELHD